jgi:hypothetical protein
LPQKAQRTGEVFHSFPSSRGNSLQLSTPGPLPWPNVCKSSDQRTDLVSQIPEWKQCTGSAVLPGFSSSSIFTAIICSLSSARPCDRPIAIISQRPHHGFTPCPDFQKILARNDGEQCLSLARHGKAFLDTMAIGEASRRTSGTPTPNSEYVVRRPHHDYC